MVMEPVTGFFQLLSDKTRLSILQLLWAKGELCVCEITGALEESQPKISRHLALLREGRIILDQRRGTWVHYRLHPDMPQWQRQILAECFAQPLMGAVLETHLARLGGAAADARHCAA